MKHKIIDGREVAGRLRARVAKEIATLAEEDIKPCLATILVGDDSASHVYVRNKITACGKVGIRSEHYNLPNSVSEKELLRLIDKLNEDEGIDGILVQLPLPNQIAAHAVIDLIDPQKDVDGFHLINAGKLMRGNAELVPCTALGCLILLRQTFSDLSGKRALIIGRSNIVGRPLSLLLLHENCTVIMAHSRTVNIEEECRRADIVVAATGVPKLVKGGWLNSDAVVLDVGISRVETDAGMVLMGDVEFQKAIEHVKAISPVPGGVGPMTIACLLYNTLVAACRRRGLTVPDKTLDL
jgi:methylenetetrahydrofolate dehydrogenase (NADP+) / methenyltetrahydrofolate cyclohydrolase